MSKIKFKIVTPERLVITKEVDQVTLPTLAGEITILPNHIPLVGILNSGVLTLISDGKEEVIAVVGGFFRISGDEVEILADSAEKGDELDMNQVIEAKERAEKALIEARNTENIDYTGLQATLERELARLKTVKKHRSHYNINLS